MAEVDTSFYPKPTPNQNNPLQTIMQLGQAQNSLGDLAVGEAMQKALQPDGGVDVNTLSGILSKSPAGAAKAVPTLDAVQRLKQSGFAADQAGLETFQKRMALTHHLFSGLASMDNPTIKDVYDVAARALDPSLDGKKYGITLPVIMNAIKAFRGPDGQPLSSAEIKKRALQIQTQAATTAEVLGQHSPGFQAVDRNGTIEFVPTGTRENPAVGTVIPKNLPPTTPVATPRGTQYLGEQPAAPAATRGGAPVVPIPPSRPAGAPSVGSEAVPGTSAAMTPTPVRTESFPRAPVPSGPAASLPPGYQQSAEELAKGGAQTASQLYQEANTSPTRRALLGNLYRLVQDFKPGVAADWDRVAKNFAIRNLPLPSSLKEAGAVFDEKSLASQEEFNKMAQQLAQAQFQALGGTGTDAKLNSAVSTSPNELLSYLGNDGIIRMLMGNEDALMAKAKAMDKWVSENGPDTVHKFNLNWAMRFDPRVYQFKYMTQAERQNYVNEMDATDRQQFIENLTYANKNNWVDFKTPAVSKPPRRGERK